MTFFQNNKVPILAALVLTLTANTAELTDGVAIAMDSQYQLTAPSVRLIPGQRGSHPIVAAAASFLPLFEVSGIRQARSRHRARQAKPGHAR
jgi:hypothetical protein